MSWKQKALDWITGGGMTAPSEGESEDPNRALARDLVDFPWTEDQQEWDQMQVLKTVPGDKGTEWHFSLQQMKTDKSRYRIAVRETAFGVRNGNRSFFVEKTRDVLNFEARGGDYCRGLIPPAIQRDAEGLARHYYEVTRESKDAGRAEGEIAMVASASAAMVEGPGTQISGSLKADRRHSVPEHSPS